VRSKRARAGYLLRCYSQRLAPPLAPSGIYGTTLADAPHPRRVKIVPRYVLREHLGPLVFALSALTSLLLLNFIAKRFGELVGKGLPWSVIAEFLLLSVPFTVAMTMPMAVLVATLHTFSRLAAENEITAFKASGVSMQRLVRPVILAGAAITVLMTWFNDQVLPRANHRLATLQADIAQVKPTLALSEQVINEVVPKQMFLRAGRIQSGTNQLRDVTIYDLGDPSRRRTIVADSGLLSFSPSGEDLLLTLFDGSMTEVASGTPERLQRSFFGQNVIRVRGIATRLDRNNGGNAFKSDREMTVCELQARVNEVDRQRQMTWTRLKQAEGAESARPDTAPELPGGAGRAYCSFLRRVQAALTPKEAVAAVVTSQPPARRPKAPARPALDQEAIRLPDPGPIEDPVMVRGLTQDLEIHEGNIDSYRVEIEKKFAIATACLVFVLLGAPVALRFPRGGVGMTIGVSLGVFAIYYMGLLAGETLADNGYVDPAIAMWGTNALLGAIGIYLTARLGSEGSTSRGSESSEFWLRVLARFRPKRRAA
jgi:lipopolysaccharide export system permease protein